MYRTIDDFIKDWRQETTSTLRIFRTLTNASLSQKVTPEGRSLGFLAWHITTSLGEMSGRTGLHVTAPGNDTPMPSSAADIAGAYLSAARSVGDEIQEHWNDASLMEEVEMYGEKWKRGFALASLLRHQTHHRGQMTVLMRQAGLPVPGVCGPSREEWAQWGMPAMK
jgi:uncharacterized damage-inducible protein DinB